MLRSREEPLSPDVDDWTSWLRGQTPELIAVPTGEPPTNLTILGTFKNWPTIREIRRQFKELGFHTLAPQGYEIVEDRESFPILDADLVKVERIEEMLGHRLTKFQRAVALERLFTLAIEESDFVYVVGQEREDIGDGSYYGVTVAEEIGFARGGRKPLFANTRLSPTLDAREGVDSPASAFPSTIKVYSPYEIAASVRSQGILPVPQPWYRQ